MPMRSRRAIASTPTAMRVCCSGVGFSRRCLPGGGRAGRGSLTGAAHPCTPPLRYARPGMTREVRMTTETFTFTVNKTDGAARTGEIRMPRGVIRTPAFMPVGTAATVKAMYPDQVKALGADVVLGNTYHLMLRPGAERVAQARRAASVHELALSDPHRFRRLPGHVPVGPAQDRRDRRHLPVAYRRLDPCADARSAPSRSRACSAPTSRCSSTNA